MNTTKTRHLRVHSSLPAIQTVVSQLESNDVRVELSHYVDNAHIPTRRGLSIRISGATYMEMSHKDWDRPLFGVAYCSKSDTFDRAKGTQVAFGRCMKQLHHTFGRKQVKDMLATA